MDNHDASISVKPQEAPNLEELLQRRELVRVRIPQAGDYGQDDKLVEVRAYDTGQVLATGTTLKRETYREGKKRITVEERVPVMIEFNLRTEMYHRRMNQCSTVEFGRRTYDHILEQALITLGNSQLLERDDIDIGKWYQSTCSRGIGRYDDPRRYPELGEFLCDMEQRLAVRVTAFPFGFLKKVFDFGTGKQKIAEQYELIATAEASREYDSAMLLVRPFMNLPGRYHDGVDMYLFVPRAYSRSMRKPLTQDAEYLPTSENTCFNITLGREGRREWLSVSSVHASSPTNVPQKLFEDGPVDIRSKVDPFLMETLLKGAELPLYRLWDSIKTAA